MASEDNDQKNNNQYTGPFKVYFHFEGMPAISANIYVIEDKKVDTLQFIADGFPSYEANTSEEKIVFSINTHIFCEVEFKKIIQIQDQKGNVLWQRPMRFT